MTKIDTVLFDMDGTLLDTLDDLTASANWALEQAGLPRVTREKTRMAAGYASVVLMDRLSNHALGDTNSCAFKELLQTFSEHYAQHNLDHTAPYPGLEELLVQLNKRAIKMAVVSNKIHAATEELCKKFFGNYITCAVGFSPERPKKPAPEMAWYALEKLESTPEHAIYIGDSDPDVQIATRAGCVSVACTWGFRSREELERQNPDYLIDRPAQLLEIVDKLNGA